MIGTLQRSFESDGEMQRSERESILSELTPPFVVYQPTRQTAPFVWCSPHSGRIYSRAFLEMVKLDPLALRKSEDCYVDGLVGSIASLGAPLIAARFPRAYLDVNREPYELDPQLFDGPLPDYANTQSARVVGGLGTLARIVADGEEIYARRLPLAVAFERIDMLYKPFHAELSAMLEKTKRLFGYAVLIDCHSMPSNLMAQHGGLRPDIVLGDRFGAACSSTLSVYVRDRLTRLGYETQMNRPYAGGFITEHYGRPSRGFHTLQIEINRALYMNETTLERTRGYEKLQRDLTALAARMFAEMPSLNQKLAPGREAAE